MIFQNNNRQLEKSGEFKSQTFGIKNAGKIFKILVDGIYSDPYGSIVREYVSNAVDANTESGSTKNVIVKWINKNVITGSEETLIIKDFGIGISPDRMFDIFCNLGETTKDQSNDYIGSWGLGSKVSFKYTDSFTVRTIFEGVEYLYNLNLNQEGVAEANLIYSQPTEEESGTEVQIPIKEGDGWKFVEAIKKQLFFFPNIDYININVDKPNIIEEDEDYVVTTNCPISKINLKLGNVLYPINWDIINVDVPIHQKLTLKFNIGEIYPIASREAIDYTEETKNKIVEKINTVRELYTYKKLEEINTCNNYFTWSKLVNIYEGNSFVFNHDIQPFKGVVKHSQYLSYLKDFLNVYVADYHTPYSKSNRRKIATPYIKYESPYRFNEIPPTIYFKSKIYSAAKSMYLYRQHGKFLVIEKFEYKSIDGIVILSDSHTRVKYEKWEQIRDFLWNHIINDCGAINYDEVEIPEEEKVVIKKEKVLKDPDYISYKKFTYEAFRWNNQRYRFTNEKDRIDYIAKNFYIYSYIDEGDDFIEFIKLFNIDRLKPDSYTNFTFIKIGRNYEKLINGVHYSKLKNQEMTIEELKCILTANYIISNSEYEYLEGLYLLKDINPDIYAKYFNFRDYINRWKYDYYRDGSKTFVNATIQLAIKNNHLDNDMLKLFNELVEYNKDIKLLKFLTDSRITENKQLLTDFLELKGKTTKQEELLNQLKLELNV